MSKPKPNVLLEWKRQLAWPVDGASLAIFRICLGLAVAFSMFKWLIPTGSDSRLAQHFAASSWTFPYPGFEWVTPVSIPLLQVCFLATGVAALLFAAGVWYRFSAVLMCIGYVYFFLLDAALFNNHYYLICLFTFLSIWIPANRRFVVRLAHARRIRGPGTDVPMWSIFLLRVQMFVVYFYGGIAKINADWLTGEPIIATGMACRELLAGLIPIPDVIEPIHFAQAMAWIGLLFDLSIGFLLLIPRTRLLAVALTAIFHGLNCLLLPIGVFPFLGFTASLIFLAPDWPIRLGRWMRSPRIPMPDRNWLIWGAFAIPGLGALLGWQLPSKRLTENQNSKPLGNLLLIFVCSWILFQAIFPLRHFLIAGDPSWTEEGQHFAWRMMLRQKAAGHLTLHLDDPGNYVDSSTGHQRIDWSKTPGAELKAVFFPIDGSRFDWSQHPGLNTLYEGLVGYRIIHAAHATSDTELANEKGHLLKYWQQKPGREFEIRETRPLKDCLAAALSRLGRESVDGSVDEWKRTRAAVEMARTLANKLPEAQGDQRNSIILRIHDLLWVALRSTSGDAISSELALVHPFVLIGGKPGRQRFLVLARRETPVQMQQLAEKIGAGDSFAVWTDFTRLRGYQWQNLPRWFPVVESRELPIMWNYFRELNARQIEQLAVRPVMIRQLSKRIASQWASACGRTPEVHAYSCVMMNYHHPVPLVDPAVDLATIDYSHFSHNNWILPFNSRRIGIANRTRTVHRR